MYGAHLKPPPYDQGLWRPRATIVLIRKLPFMSQKGGRATSLSAQLAKYNNDLQLLEVQSILYCYATYKNVSLKNRATTLDTSRLTISGTISTEILGSNGKSSRVISRTFTLVSSCKTQPRRQVSLRYYFSFNNHTCPTHVWVLGNFTWLLDFAADVPSTRNERTFLVLLTTTSSSIVNDGSRKAGLKNEKKGNLFKEGTILSIPNVTTSCASCSLDTASIPFTTCIEYKELFSLRCNFSKWG